MLLAVEQIRPYGMMVLCERLEKPGTTPGGIVLPDTAYERSPYVKVLAVGNGLMADNGEVRLPPTTSKPGDICSCRTFEGVKPIPSNDNILLVDGRRLECVKSDEAWPEPVTV